MAEHGRRLARKAVSSQSDDVSGYNTRFTWRIPMFAAPGTLPDFVDSLPRAAAERIARNREHTVQ